MTCIHHKAFNMQYQKYRARLRENDVPAFQVLFCLVFVFLPYSCQRDRERACTCTQHGFQVTSSSTQAMVGHMGIQHLVYHATHWPSLYLYNSDTNWAAKFLSNLQLLFPSLISVKSKFPIHLIQPFPFIIHTFSPSRKVYPQNNNTLLLTSSTTTTLTYVPSSVSRVLQ